MREQSIVLRNQENFNLKHIFECGQCFRWNVREDDTYLGVVGENVICAKQKGKDIFFTSWGKDNLESFIKEYFDFDTDYTKVKQILSKVDKPMKEALNYGEGIRILNQDLWETLISFIISANNNIPRIKGIIERLAKEYGKKMVWKEEVFYTIPTPEELAKASVKDLRNLGLGFRDKRIYETTLKVLNKQVDLEQLKQEENTSKIREELLKLPGVGPKVADCILLFSSLKRYEVFPIDVWVRRVINDLYIQNPNEEKVNKKEIEKLAKQKYGNLAGLAQQYLFYWRRDVS